MTIITVITGCSSGIGLATARLLSAEQDRILVPTVRRQEDLAQLPVGANVKPCLLDIRNDAQCDDLAALVDRQMSERSGKRKLEVVLNAGFGQPGFLGDLPVDALTEQVAVNLTGQYRVLKSLWPLLSGAEDVRVVFVSSVLGFTTVPGRVAYCASKAALESLADGLRIENPAWKVVLIEPGPVEARFGMNALAALHRWIDVEKSVHREKYLAARHRMEAPNRDRVPAIRVAATIQKALNARRPRTRYRICRSTHMAWLLRCLPTRIADLLLRRAI